MDKGFEISISIRVNYENNNEKKLSSFESFNTS